MVKFVEENDLEAAFPYLDNITICGKDQKENGVHMEHFLEDSKRKNICYNTDKCIFSTQRPYLWICHRGWSTIAPLLIVYGPYVSFLFHTTQRP